MHDDERTIEDIEAELIVAGCVVASPRGAELAAERVTADHFTRPHLRDLFDAAGDLPATPPTFDDPLEPGLADQRVAAAADVTGITVADVDLLVARRLTMVDGNGVYAARLQRAHTRRTLAAIVDDAGRLLRADSDDLAHEVSSLLDAAAVHCEQLR